MTAQQIALAVRWLTQQAQQTGIRQAEHLRDRRHKPRKVVTLPRDTKGRWIRHARTD